MSRTYKDRPYWVKNNDARYDREEMHDHARIGTTVLRKRPVFDANGEPVMEEVETIKKTPYEKFDFSNHQGTIIEDSAGRFNKPVFISYAYGYKRYVCERITILVQKTDWVEEPFYKDDYCTIDLPDDGSWCHSRTYRPCEKSVYFYQFRQWNSPHRRHRKKRDTVRSRYAARSTANSLVKELRYVELEEELTETMEELTTIPNYRLRVRNDWD